MHKEERKTINVVIVSSKLIDRACSFVPLTTSTPRITTFEDGKPGSRDASRRFDDHRTQRGCEGLRGQRASVCIQVVRSVCRSCSSETPHPCFITQGCRIACINPSPKTVCGTERTIRCNDRTVRLDTSQAEGGTHRRHGTKSPSKSPRSQTTTDTRPCPITRTRA